MEGDRADASVALRHSCSSPPAAPQRSLPPPLRRPSGGPKYRTMCASGSVRLRVESLDRGRDDANVTTEVEDEVVDIRRRHGTQGG
jgi:hypothetical protein